MTIVAGEALMATPTSPSLFLGKMVHRRPQLFYQYRLYEVALSAGGLVHWLRHAWQRLAAEESLQLASKNRRGDRHSTRKTCGALPSFLPA